MSTTVNTSATLLVTTTAPCQVLVKNLGPLAILVANNSGMTGATSVAYGASTVITFASGLASGSSSVSVYATIASGTGQANASVLPYTPPQGWGAETTQPYGDNTSAPATDQFVQEAIAGTAALGTIDGGVS